jgi:hypothetical protein
MGLRGSVVTLRSPCQSLGLNPRPSRSSAFMTPIRANIAGPMLSDKDQRLLRLALDRHHARASGSLMMY